MGDRAIEELSKDCKDHLRRALEGDARCSYAAREAYDRLLELGADKSRLEEDGIDEPAIARAAQAARGASQGD